LLHISRHYIYLSSEKLKIKMLVTRSELRKLRNKI